MTRSTNEVLQLVSQERERQDSIWGGPTHDDQHRPEHWAGLLSKRLGKALMSTGTADWQTYLVELAALAVAAVEASKRDQLPAYRRTLQPVPASAAFLNLPKPLNYGFDCATIEEAATLVAKRVSTTFDMKVAILAPNNEMLKRAWEALQGLPPDLRPAHRSKLSNRVEWALGSFAQGFSALQPTRMRGFSASVVWAHMPMACSVNALNILAMTVRSPLPLVVASK